MNLVSRSKSNGSGPESSEEGVRLLDFSFNSSSSTPSDITNEFNLVVAGKDIDRDRNAVMDCATVSAIPAST